jgi:hypothetical protein
LGRAARDPACRRDCVSPAIVGSAMTEHKFFAKTVHVQKDHSGLPRLYIITQANEHVEIVMGDAQAKIVEPEIQEPCA